MKIKNFLNLFLTALLLIFIATGCEFLGDVLAFGFWTGVIVVILVILIIGWIIRKIF